MAQRITKYDVVDAIQSAIDTLDNFEATNKLSDADMNLWGRNRMKLQQARVIAKQFDALVLKGVN